MISPRVVGGTVETVRSVFKTFMIIMIISEDDKPTHRGALLLARGPSGLLIPSFMLLRGAISTLVTGQLHFFNQNYTKPLKIQQFQPNF